MSEGGIVKRADPESGSVWIEEVIHATCRNCGYPLRRHREMPGFSGGITWFHPHNSHQRHNGYECDPKPVRIVQWEACLNCAGSGLQDGLHGPTTCDVCDGQCVVRIRDERGRAAHTGRGQK